MGTNIQVSAIILAAGESKRMGMMKQLLPLGRSTILECVLDNFLKSKVEEIIVVIGHESAEIVKIIRERKIKIAVNPLYNQGMSTSIVSGLKLVSSGAQGIMIALGDQPFIDSSTINSLIDAFCANKKKIIIPVYQDKRGHPIIFSHNYKEQLMSLKGDTGGREVIERYPDDVLEVNVTCDGVLRDIDTREEYYSSLKNMNH